MRINYVLNIERNYQDIHCSLLHFSYLKTAKSALKLTVISVLLANFHDFGILIY